MESTALQELWNKYDKSLDSSLKTNISSLRQLKLNKVKHKLQRIFIVRLLELLVFLVIVILLGNYVVNRITIPFLAVNGFIALFFAVVGLWGSIGQLTLLNQLNYTGPVVSIRKKIEQINKHEWFFTKLMLLSAAFWWVFIIVGIDILAVLLTKIAGTDVFSQVVAEIVSYNSNFIGYLLVNSLLIIPLFWLFIKISYKNIHINWVRKTIHFFAGIKTLKAIAFLNDIERFERGEAG